MSPESAALTPYRPDAHSRHPELRVLRFLQQAFSLASQRLKPIIYARVMQRRTVAPA